MEGNVFDKIIKKEKMKTEANEPINSVEVNYVDGKMQALQTSQFTGLTLGLTKREYFAGLAMQGLITSCPQGNLHNTKEGCELAVQWANALIEALNK